MISTLTADPGLNSFPEVLVSVTSVGPVPLVVAVQVFGFVLAAETLAKSAGTVIRADPILFGLFESLVIVTVSVWLMELAATLAEAMLAEY